MLSTSVPKAERGFPVEPERFNYWVNFWVENTRTGWNQFSTNRVGLIDGELKFIIIEARTLGRSNFSYEDRLALYNSWESLKNDY